MTLTIGIPSRGVDISLFRVIEHALSLDVDEVLVGINPKEEQDIDLSRYSDPRLKIFLHPHDLGLYGNFRFLAQESSSIYFCWLCTDDALSPDIPGKLRGLNDRSLNLIIPNWVWVEYMPEAKSPFELSKQVPGTYPDLQSAHSTLLSALHSEPS
jgi:hypothetical protein